MIKGYSERRADWAAYNMYLEMLNEPDKNDLIHLQNCIRESIRTDLTEVQRKYLLAYMSGDSVSEIAAQFGVNKATVSRVLNRALDNLFDHIKYATPRTLKMSTTYRKYRTRLVDKEAV